VKVRIYSLVKKCVEDGAALGVRRAKKHADDPSEDIVVEHVITEIMNQLDEWFMFEVENGG
jgi:hypothetical protein